MRFSRPCYNKMRRCPGWAGGGWAVTKRANVCNSAYVNYKGTDNGDLSRWWKVQFRKCDQCKTIIVPYLVRFIDPSYYWVLGRSRVSMWWYYRKQGSS